jgi:hypothetical protein
MSVSVGATVHEGPWSLLFLQFLNHTQSVGLFGWGISPPQSRYLHTGQHKHRINTNIHASSGICTHDSMFELEKTVHALNRAAHSDWLMNGNRSCIGLLLVVM